MKVQYFVFLSVILHLIGFIYLKDLKENKDVEIIDAELIGSVGTTNKSFLTTEKQKSLVPSPKVALSQAKKNSDIVNSQTISNEESSIETLGSGSSMIPPKVFKEFLAPYPKEARRAHIEGDVVLAIIIDKEGHVEQASVIEALGYGLDDAALTAIRQFIFNPGVKDGKVVRTQIKYRYKFRLD